MDRAWLNKINREARINPEKALKKLHSMVKLDLALRDLDPKKAFRTSEFKRDREIRGACIFCYGMSRRIGQQVWVYPIEESDFDFVAAWEVGDRRHFAPTQLKEVVPKHRNPNTSLQSVIDTLVDYRASEQLTVALHLNRQGRFDPNEITMPALKLAALWVFSAVSEDQIRGYLVGNMLEEPTCTLFDYPV
jgi:hypothetical protein